MHCRDPQHDCAPRHGDLQHHSHWHNGKSRPPGHGLPWEPDAPARANGTPRVHSGTLLPLPPSELCWPSLRGLGIKGGPDAIAEQMRFVADCPCRRLGSLGGRSPLADVGATRLGRSRGAGPTARMLRRAQLRGSRCPEPRACDTGTRCPSAAGGLLQRHPSDVPQLRSRHSWRPCATHACLCQCSGLGLRFPRRPALVLDIDAGHDVGLLSRDGRRSRSSQVGGVGCSLRPSGRFTSLPGRRGRRRSCRTSSRRAARTGSRAATNRRPWDCGRPHGGGGRAATATRRTQTPEGAGLAGIRLGRQCYAE